MSIVVPPAPSQDAAPGVMERLARLANDATPAEQSASGKVPSRMLLLASCILSALGMLLLVCTIIVVHMPQTLIAQGILAVCALLFRGGAL